MPASCGHNYSKLALIQPTEPKKKSTCLALMTSAMLMQQFHQNKFKTALQVLPECCTFVEGFPSRKVCRMLCTPVTLSTQTSCCKLWPVSHASHSKQDATYDSQCTCIGLLWACHMHLSSQVLVSYTVCSHLLVAASLTEETYFSLFLVHY